MKIWLRCENIRLILLSRARRAARSANHNSLAPPWEAIKRKLFLEISHFCGRTPQNESARICIMNKRSAINIIIWIIIVNWTRWWWFSCLTGRWRFVSWRGMFSPYFFIAFVNCATKNRSIKSLRLDSDLFFRFKFSTSFIRSKWHRTHNCAQIYDLLF